MRTNMAHGGNIYEAARILGLSESDILDLSASINPLGIPASAKKALRDAEGILVHYPDPYSVVFKKAVSARFGVAERCVIAGNGSTELIYLLPRAFRPRRVLITAPAFSEYERAVGVVDKKATIVHMPLLKDDCFRIQPDRFAGLMKGAGMAFLCNPNNPTGGILSKEEVLWIAKKAKSLGCLLIVDEAFMDFSPSESVLAEAVRNPYLIVLRSMTKFYALTGLRAGYAVGHETTVAGLAGFKEPWSMNTLAERASAAALADEGHWLRSLRLIESERAYIEKRLARLGVKFYPSSANYYLIELDSAKQKRAVLAGLFNKGILVRDCANFRGLGGKFIRTAVRRRKENLRLLSALREIIENRS